MNNRVQEGILRVREDPRAWSKGNISRRMLSTPESSGPTTMMKTRHDREVEQRRCSCIVWIRISDEGRKELYVRKKMSRLETTGHPVIWAWLGFWNERVPSVPAGVSKRFDGGRVYIFCSVKIIVDLKILGSNGMEYGEGEQSVHVCNYAC